MIRERKNKHHASMINGEKRPSEKAREVFRRPVYAGLFSSKGSGGDKNGNRS